MYGDVPFMGERNFRELGGLPAQNGKRIKRGLLWRGASTACLVSYGDRALLDELGLKTILDLRSTIEEASAHDIVPDGCTYIRICGLCGPEGEEISFSPKDIEWIRSQEKTVNFEASGPVGMYAAMLGGLKAYKKLFELLENGETPLLFHCAAGKDRTGIAAMLILLALGADDETITANYNETNRCRKPIIDAEMERRAKAIAADPSEAKMVQQYFGVDSNMMQTMLRVIRERWGSTENYLLTVYGLDETRLQHLREMYLEEE